MALAAFSAEAESNNGTDSMSWRRAVFAEEGVTIVPEKLLMGGSSASSKAKAAPSRGSQPSTDV
jgi:hypothetical protein